MNTLRVYLNNEKVGILEQEGSGLLRFSYDMSWLTRTNAIPISRSLPLREQPFENGEPRPFFAGILPEEEPRVKIAEFLGISDTNDYALLERIGGECAGAISLLSETLESTAIQNYEIQPLSDNELHHLLNQLPIRPLLIGENDMRLSLAGAQNKLPVIVRKNKIYLPVGNTPTTHILKPEPKRFPGLAINEAFCMKLAHAVGLKVAETSLHNNIGISYILVKRYDRTIDADNNLGRLHQEDFCQALGIPPERKYQSEGGPTIKDCIDLIKSWSTTPVIDLPEFINGLIFNVLIGNADAHAKNFSFLYSNTERRLTPYYDLVSTIAWKNLSKNAAMNVGGCKSISVFNAGDWRKMTLKAGVSWPITRERITLLCNKVLDNLDNILKEVNRYDESPLQLLHTEIKVRSEKLRNAVR